MEGSLDEAELNKEVLNLLGEDVTTDITAGPSIQKDLASRWTGILKNGVSDEERTKLIKKYPVPENCPLIAPPKLNLAVASAISESVTRRDTRIATLQGQLGAAISAIGSVITILLKKEEGENLSHVENLSDACRLLADMHHSESTSRRDLASYDLNKSLKETLNNVPVDGWLFGENLEERVKASKSIARSSLDLKSTKPTSNKKQSSTSRNLNWKSLPRSTSQGVRQGRRQMPYQHRGQSAVQNQSRRGYYRKAEFRTRKNPQNK